MDDDSLEKLALIAVLLGLTIGYFFVFDFESEDAYYLNNDDIIYFEGSVLNSFETDNGQIISLLGCRELSVYYQGSLDLDIGSNVRVEGSMDDDFLFAEHVFIE